MQLEIKTWLFDIQRYGTEMEAFVEGLSYEQFLSDLKTQRAVERNLTVIGEAMRRILDMEQEIAVTDARRIVDMRNRIIHGYEKISERLVWEVLQNDLRLLLSEVTALLNS